MFNLSEEYKKAPVLFKVEKKHLYPVRIVTKVDLSKCLGELKNKKRTCLVRDNIRNLNNLINRKKKDTIFCEHLKTNKYEILKHNSVLISYQRGILKLKDRMKAKESQKTSKRYKEMMSFYDVAVKEGYAFCLNCQNNMYDEENLMCENCTLYFHKNCAVKRQSEIECNKCFNMNQLQEQTQIVSQEQTQSNNENLSVTQIYNDLTETSPYIIYEAVEEEEEEPSLDLTELPANININEPVVKESDKTYLINHIDDLEYDIKILNEDIVYCINTEKERKELIEKCKRDIAVVKARKDDYQKRIPELQERINRFQRRLERKT